MKSEKRHELQTNTLADQLGEGLEKHGAQVKLAAAGLIGVFVIIFAYLFISEQQRARQASNWTTFFMAVNSFDRGLALETVAEDFQDRKLQDTKPALWTMLSLADLKLAMGTANRFTDKKQSEEDFTIARVHFEKVRDKTRDPLMKIRATYGLAQVHESLCEPELAKKYYEQVKTEAREGSALGDAAIESLKRLEELDAQGWYVWFKDQEVVRPEPVDPNLPASLQDLPDRPNLDIDIGSGLLGPLTGDGAGTATGDGATEPSEGGEAPATDPTPNEEGDKPATETPDTTPADGASEGEKPAEKPEAETSDPKKPDVETPASEKSETEKTETEKPETEKPAIEPPKPAENPAGETPAPKSGDGNGQ